MHLGYKEIHTHEITLKIPTYFNQKKSYREIPNVNLLKTEFPFNFEEIHTHLVYM